MADRLTFVWVVLIAMITTTVGLVINYAIDTRWVAPVAMMGAMVFLAFIGRIRPGRRK